MGGLPEASRQAKTEREFKRALEQGAIAEEITAGARRYAADPARIAQSRKDDRFTAHPYNWLRDGRWTDKPTTNGGVTIDQHGNVVETQPALNGFEARVAARYPDGGRRWR